MVRYDAKQICLDGHHITNRAKTGSRAKEHCDKCGAETITECPECGGIIKGDDLDSNVVAVGFEPSIPSHCEHCGEPFPWTGDGDNETEQENVTWNLEAEEAIDRICNRFSNVVYHLNDRYDGRGTIEISDEYDVQDVLNALLRIHFDDVRPEEGTPSHAGSSSRIDFLLKKEKIGIEVKKTREGLDEGELGSELSTDKERYEAHPDCDRLICFIYDPERRLRNPHVLSDLDAEDEDFSVKVIVSPRR
jgi:hypothetical protein